MRRLRRRPTYYSTISLRDGTVLAGHPIRKPADRILKRDGMRIDEDNICTEYPRGGEELSDTKYEGRTRFQDIIANKLNVHRALRSLVLPKLMELESRVVAIQSQLDRIEHALIELAKEPIR